MSGGAPARPRAGIVVTGTEVLAGLVADRNGPWLSERLRERGVELAHVVIVGDRPADLRAALGFLAGARVDLVVTSGGLGPTADDLTAEVVAGFLGRPVALDTELEQRIRAIVRDLRGLPPAGGDPGRQEAMRAGARKQALVPEGAVVLEPVGTAPGLLVTGADGSGPLVAVLPGPPGELRPMWEAAAGTEPLRSLLSRAGRLEQRMLRLFGVPESELAASLRALGAGGMVLDRLEVTTCMRRGEIEIATVFGPGEERAYEAFAAGIRDRHGAALFSDDGSTIDEQVAGLLAGRTVATAESCTGGLMSARLTDRAGSSAYALGGLVVYSNEAKTRLGGVPEALIERHGAVSPEVAAALADGAIERFGADVGIGITGIAGPGGGSDAKPVGTVCLGVAERGGERADRVVVLPGGRAAVRDRTTTVALHMLRGLLLRIA